MSDGRVAAGVDQVMFVMQAGRNQHEHICESLELFAREVLPRFADGRQETEAAKADRLAAAVDAALARRAPARSLPSPYLIDEKAEVAAARRLPRPPLRQLAGQARRTAAASVRHGTASGARQLLSRVSDSRLEQVFGAAPAQLAIFAAMAHRLDPARAAGFAGAIVYDLGLTGGTRSCWTIDVAAGRAAARPGRAELAALTLRLPLIAFVRAAVSGSSFLSLIADGTITLDGDLALASRLAEMFGAQIGLLGPSSPQYGGHGNLTCPRGTFGTAVMTNHPNIGRRSRRRCDYAQ